MIYLVHFSLTLLFFVTSPYCLAASNYSSQYVIVKKGNNIILKSNSENEKSVNAWMGDRLEITAIAECIIDGRIYERPINNIRWKIDYSPIVENSANNELQLKYISDFRLAPGGAQLYDDRYVVKDQASIQFIPVTPSMLRAQVTGNFYCGVEVAYNKYLDIEPGHPEVIFSELPTIPSTTSVLKVDLDRSCQEDPDAVMMLGSCGNGSSSKNEYSMNFNINSLRHDQSSFYVSGTSTGKVGVVQVGLGQRRFSRKEQGSIVHRCQNENSKTFLDTPINSPESPFYGNAFSEIEIKNSKFESISLSFQDSPHLYLTGNGASDKLSADIDDLYVARIMFKSTKDDSSVYVPLGEIYWAWKAEVKKSPSPSTKSGYIVKDHFSREEYTSYRWLKASHWPSWEINSISGKYQICDR